MSSGVSSLDKNDLRTPTDSSRIESSRTTESSIYQKCQLCSKKVMNYGKCKCLNFYCGKHLHQHKCSFSYFEHHKSILEKNSTKIESVKIIRL
jgi:hypothetical protein